MGRDVLRARLRVVDWIGRSMAVGASLGRRLVDEHGLARDEFR